MRTGLIFLIFFGFFASADSNREPNFDIAFDRSEILKGRATWKKSGELAYLETHTIFYKEGRRVKVETVYRKPSGEKFANFVSDYTKHPYIPAYRFRDSRFGREEGVEWINPRMIRIFGRKSSQREMHSTRMGVPKVGFAGQGFNFYLVDNLQSIVASEKPIEVEFVIPLAQKSYGFRVRTRGPVEGNIASFRAEIDNWLIRLFAPHIDVKYDLQKKILLEYRGPSNLLNEDKDIEPVVIKYDTSGISIKQAANE